jgi:outer membrane protein assembly factor BamA
MPPRASYPAALVAAGLLIVSHPALAQRKSDEMERPLVRKVELKGVKHVDQDELQESIATRASGCRSVLLSFLCVMNDWDAVYDHQYLDPREFQRDVLRIKVFYWKRGFREADVDTVVVPRDGDRVRVRFNVTEGPPTLVGRVEVMRPTELLPDRTMRRLVQVRAGEPFSTLALDTTLVRLRQAMWQRGYADAQVIQRTTVDTTSRQAVIAIGVESGPRSTVGEIHVHGAVKVSEAAIRNSLLLDEGDVFVLDRMLRSQRALYESGLFRRAALFVTRGESGAPCAAFDGLLPDPTAEGEVARPDSVKRIEVCVEEAPLREARTSAGFNTVDFFQVEGRFSHLNFLGGARRLDVQGALGNLLATQLNGRGPFTNVQVNDDDRARYFAPTWQTSIDLRQRWFRSARNTIGVGAFASRRSSPGIFVDKGYGGTASLTREVMERGNVSTAYRYEITNVEAGDVYFCINYGVCDRGTIGALRGTQRMSPVTLNVTIDRSSDPFSPITGYRLRGDFDHAAAWTQSDFRYNRAFVDYALYRRLGARGALASRVRLGWVGALASTGVATGASGVAEGDILHPRRRFYSGGSQSVRGFGENQLGPKVLTIPAAALRGADNARCSEADIRDCDPNTYLDADGDAVLYDDDQFTPRPLGGNALVEGSVEARVPIFRDFADGKLFGALFVDGGWLRGRSLGGGPRSDAALTPGFGVRYRSPVGPIRVDLGINPFVNETLPVITQLDSVTPSGDTVRRLVRLNTERRYEPGRSASNWLSATLQRLTLHLSIGEAF